MSIKQGVGRSTHLHQWKGRRIRRMGRRIFVLVSVMVAALVLAGGAALAVTPDEKEVSPASTATSSTSSDAQRSAAVGQLGAAWGDNSYGQLGNGTDTSSNVPVGISNLSSEATKAVADGRLHSLALKTDGTVWAWGDNSSGQLGNGTNTDSDVPVQVRGLRACADRLATFHIYRFSARSNRLLITY